MESACVSVLVRKKKMNKIIACRIIELSEPKSRFEKLKSFVQNWKYVCFIAILALTLKTAAEQIIMALR